MQEQSQGIQNYSLDADIATGWKPKMKIIGPMPLNFDNSSLDTLIKPLTHSDTSIYQVVYLGLRPRDTFEMHSYLAKNYRYKFRHLLNTDYSHLKPFFRKFYSQFEPACKMPFNGMNPKVKSTIQFESRFQSGNLDYVVRTKTNEYDLFLRIDSNTNGHIMWYYFKVSNSLDKSKTIRLNICNLRRSKAFYDKCLQPYVFRKTTGWRQEANNLTVSQERVRFYKQHMIFNSSEEAVEPNIYRKLSFDLQLKPFEEVQIAYSIPYTYSQLLEDIRNLKIESKKNEKLEFEIDMSNISLSGLQIPYLKIYQKEDATEPTKKQNILIIGRQHPGQSNGSHVLKGFLEQLIKSNEKNISELRSNFIFHVVPMLNPDGVVIGNFRTSLYGKDLNRLFRKNVTFMIPEIEFCKNLVFQVTKKKKKKMFMFLDFHGHSVKRNAFCFAPSTFETNSVEDVRQFPKIISEVTQMFRFPSCSFRISNQKKTTARAVFCGDAKLCYTIQTSNWSYFSKKDKQNILFNEILLLELGKCLLKSLGVYITRIVQRKMLRKRRQQQKQQQQKLIQHNSSSLFKVRQTKKIHIKTTTQNLEQDRSISTIKNSQLSNKSGQHMLPSSTRSIVQSKQNKRSSERQGKNNQQKEDDFPKIKKQLNMFRAQEIRDITENFLEEELKVMDGEQDGSASDDSDQSQKQDMDKQKFKKYMNGASKMLIQFQKAYYGDQYRSKARYELPKKTTSTKRNRSQQCNKHAQNQETKSEKLLSKIDTIIDQKQQLRNRLKKRENSNKKIKLNINTKQIDIDINTNTNNGQKQDILKSLPRISVVNYLAYEDIDEKRVFRVPKIQSVHIKNIRKY